MESLIKQMRVRFSGVHEEIRETDSFRDRRTPPQKTQSFKGDKKKSWLGSKMSQEYYYSNDDEYPVALAAAAFAIRSLEDAHLQDQRNATGGPGLRPATLTNIRSRSEDKSTKLSQPREESKKFSEAADKVASTSAATNVNVPEKVVAPAPSVKRIPTTADKQFNNIPAVESKNAEPKKADVSSRTIKKAPTFADKTSNNTANRQPENTISRPDLQSTKLPTFPQRQLSEKQGFENTKANSWEKNEMANINERYEKLKATINDWETKKMEKAKAKLEKIERESVVRRNKAREQYRTKINTIDQIAVGARAKAEENRRTEEARVKEKANRIRTTGTTPATCLCF